MLKPMLRLGFSHASPADVEREAGRIADPVERLRYLRKHGTATVQGVLPRPRLSRKSQFMIGAAALPVALGMMYWLSLPVRAPEAIKAPSLPVARPSPNQVWQVATSGVEEVYSNGLRIDQSFSTRLRPRAEYPVFALAGGSQPIAMDRTPRGIVYHTTESDMVVFEMDRTPRGIVYHTTESDMVVFEKEEHQTIERLGHQLLRYVRQNHSYHYLIDRYGRVYRVVEESDAANHAGFSVWGDERGVYVNLNDSFIGVAFEGASSKTDDITGAQLSAARQLTELLVSRYNIRPEDCVTHAQVSVSPSNMRLANHKDWARAFPFAAMNLPDNYRLPVWAVEAFGFSYDEDLLGASGGKAWPGLVSADKKLLEDAASQGADEIRYRGMLRHRYQEILADAKARQLQAEAEARENRQGRK